MSRLGLVPSEANEQKWLMTWAEQMKGTYPELQTMFHIPNGGSRNVVEAKHLVEQGVKKGVPDLFLPVPRGGCHGLFIEMKRKRGGRLSEDQAVWLEILRGQRYQCNVCKGWEEAAEVIVDYLTEGRKKAFE